MIDPCWIINHTKTFRIIRNITLSIIHIELNYETEKQKTQNSALRDTIVLYHS